MSVYLEAAHSILKEHPHGLHSDEIFRIATERGLLDCLPNPTVDSMKGILYREVNGGSKYFAAVGPGQYKAKGDTYEAKRTWKGSAAAQGSFLRARHRKT